MNSNWAEHCHYITFNGRDWVWPNIDHKLQEVNSWVGDLSRVLPRVRYHGTVIQAGGACGVWPCQLAKVFDQVITFEPDPLNYYCLERNIIPHDNIEAYRAALGETVGEVCTKLHHTEMNNVGAYYTMDAKEGVPRMRVDNSIFNRVDLICLDIEGREIEAIKGAYHTIERHQPFIMIEEKKLPQMGLDVKHKEGDATAWLEKEHGYTVIDRVHRDVVLAPPTAHEPPMEPAA